jgi:hypothetical protein
MSALILACLVSRAAEDTMSDEARGKQWWAHVQILAGDSMKGRLTGSDDYLRAAAYVVEKFKSYGLQPAGVNGSFYQPVKFDVQRVLADKSSLALVVDGKPEPLTLGTDAILGARSAQAGEVDAPLVFIGYGLHLPEAKYDDFGAIAIPTPKSMDFGWQRVASGSSQPGMRLAPTPDAARVAARHPALADDHGPLFTVTFNPAEGEKLFAGTGHTFAELLALADDQKPLPRFPLNKRVTATIVGEHSQVESPNIVARLEGSDPVLKSEYVIVSAHLDHLGVGAPIKGKTIYSGAMDDASGVASVLETARAFTASKTHPKRSVLFVIFTAEEKGLLGSRYYAGHPTVPEGSIKADLNLDMFMPIFSLKKLHVQGLEQSTLAIDAKKVGEDHHIVIAGDPEPDRNSFIRTDQYSFVQAGIPALAFKFGWEPGSPEYKAWRAWLAERYHSTQDDLSQPVDLAAAAQFNSYFADLARAVADDPSTPHYLDSSFFRRFEK